MLKKLMMKKYMIKKKNKFYKNIILLKKKKMENQKKEESHENENEDSPRSDTKTPSRWVQKNHLESKIIGNTDSRFKTRRKLLYDEEQALLLIVEPKTFKEA